MKTINLRDYYPFYNEDIFVDIPDEIEAALQKSERLERNYTRRMFWNKAQYSLDADDGIECHVSFNLLSPCELYERKIMVEQLHAAIAALPDKQGKRIFAHYILGMSNTEIARVEGVSKSRISESIDRGLQNMERVLKNTL